MGHRLGQINGGMKGKTPMLWFTTAFDLMGKVRFGVDGDNIKPELFPRPTRAKSENTLFQIQ